MRPRDARLGFVVMHELEPGRREVKFQSRSGPLRVTQSGERLRARLSRAPRAGSGSGSRRGRGCPRRTAPVAVLRATRDYLVVFESEAQVRGLRPDMARLAALPLLGLIATAPGATRTSCPASSRRREASTRTR